VTPAAVTKSIAAVVSTAAIFFAGYAAAQGGGPQPIGVTSVGPWEIVVWGVGKRVQQCTLIRAKDNAGAGYGFLIDQRGLVVSIESNAWKLTGGKAIPATFAPAKGKPRDLSAVPVSAARANVDLAANDPLLADLQVSDSATVKIGAVTLKLPFDDFNAARVTFEICVQSLGKDWKQP
jgi:hypothetical protein